jgi:hypothetical protein
LERNPKGSGKRVGHPTWATGCSFALVSRCRKINLQAIHQEGLTANLAVLR